MIIALGLSDALLGQVRGAFPGGATVVSVSRVDELPERFDPVRGAQALAPLPLAGNLDLLGLIEAFRRCYPWVPLIVLASRGGRDALEMAVRLGRIGVAMLIDMDEHDWPHRLRRVVMTNGRAALSNAVWEQANLQLSDAGATVFKVALRLAHEPFTVGQLAVACKMHERTLRKYCSRKSLPNPQWIVGWARLLLAGYLLDQGNIEKERVASQLGFDTASELQRMMRRYLQSCEGGPVAATGVFASIRKVIERQFNQMKSPHDVDVLESMTIQSRAD